MAFRVTDLKFSFFSWNLDLFPLAHDLNSTASHIFSPSSVFFQPKLLDSQQSVLLLPNSHRIITSLSLSQF